MKHLILSFLSPLNRRIFRYMVNWGLILCGKPDPPDPPDYRAAAEAQGESNLESAVATALLSNPNINTPLGSRTVSFDYGQPSLPSPSGYSGLQPPQAYQAPEQQGMPFGMGGTWGMGRNQPASQPYQEYIPGAPQGGGITSIGGVPIPRVTIDEELTPEGQERFDQEQRIMTSLGGIAEEGLGRVGESMGTPFDMSQVSEITTQPGVAGREAITQALLERQMPMLERQRQREQEALMMQGHNRGGSAWDAIQDDITRRETDARLAAILAGGQEQSRLYGMERDARQRDIQEQAYLRQLPLSEINALRTGNQPTLPQFQAYQGSQVQPAPMFNAAQAQYGADLDNYNARAAQKGQLMSGLFSLGGAALGGAGAAGGFGSLFSFQ